MMQPLMVPNPGWFQDAAGKVAYVSVICVN
jgi:hypothetical protein